MDTQTLLAFLGIAATAVFGIWAIFITVRYNRNVRITYAHDQAIALTDDITQNFPELGITFRGEPVSQNLVLLKGYLLNTGKKDISNDMVEEQITLTLPDEFEWVECKVVETSKSLRANALKADNRNVRFETGLWKSKEYMKFEALAKVPAIKADLENYPPSERPTLRLRKALLFSHRITDLKQIFQTRVPRPRTKSSRFQKPLFQLTFPFTSARMNLIVSIFLTLIGGALFCVGQFTHTTSLGYAVTIDGKNRLLNLQTTGDKISLVDGSGFKQEYSVEEFEALTGKRMRLIPRNNRELRSLGVTYIGFGLLLLFVNGIRNYRANRFLAMITNKEQIE